MMAKITRHFRKWLIGMVLAARNQAEALASRLASVEEKTAKKEIPKDKLKPFTIKGPPDHWIELVKQNAPELLHPAPPYFSPHTVSKVSEDYASENASGETDTQGLSKDNETFGNARKRDVHLFSTGSSQRSKQLQSSSATGDNRAADINIQLTDTTNMPAKDYRNADPPLSSATNQTRPLKERRLTFFLPDMEKKNRLQPSGLEQVEESPFTKRMSSEQRQSENPIAQVSSEHIAVPEDDHAENKLFISRYEKQSRPDSGQKFLSDGPFIRQGLHPGPQTDAFRISPGSDTRIQDSRQNKGKSGHDLKPQPVQTSNLSETNSALESQSLTQKNKKNGNDFMYPERGTRTDELHRRQPIEKGPAIEENQCRPAKLQWPDLAEEKGFGNHTDVAFSTVWPSLPEEKSINMESGLQQMEIRLSEMEPRTIERLKRIDEEQKGKSWNASHF